MNPLAPDVSATDLALERVVQLLNRSRRLLFITGAGISADSGLPTYRGANGLYNGTDPEEGLPIEELLSGAMLRSRPDLTWKYLAQVAQAAAGARFNRAHQVIAEMEKCFGHVCVLTQNIDGFHRSAGSQHVIDIHGDLHELYCPHCGWRQTRQDFVGLEIPPPCPACARILRPDVVLFGEYLPEDKLQRLNHELETGFDLIFSVGTTSVFPYITQPILLARELGWSTVEINPQPTRVSHLVDIRLQQGAAAALDAIWTRYQNQQRK